MVLFLLVIVLAVIGADREEAISLGRAAGVGGTDIRRNERLADVGVEGRVGRIKHRPAAIDPVEHARLLDLGEEFTRPAPAGEFVGGIANGPVDAGPAGREAAGVVVVVVEREANLLEIVAAARCPGTFASGLNSRQQEPDERPDDRDHDEELDKREARCPGRHVGGTALHDWLPVFQHDPRAQFPAVGDGEGRAPPRLPHHRR